MKPVLGPVMERFHADVEALFSPSALQAMGLDVPAPRVTFDLPNAEPEPLHVWTWGTAREFDVLGLLTGGTLKVSYHIWLGVVATSSTAEEAARIANAYQNVALQIPLCDQMLARTALELGAPAIREAEAWADADGRRHAGYLLDYEVAVAVDRDATAAEIIAAIE